jgi:hypothetical protein
MTEKEYIERTLNWWVCDNIVHPIHDGQIGLLSLNEPQVFILLRDGDQVFYGYEDFKNNLAELNFLRPSDRATADIEAILTDAYNFLVLQDREEECRYDEYIRDDI